MSENVNNNQNQEIQSETSQSQNQTQTSQASQQKRVIRRPIRRKKVCYFCKNNIDYIDYKDINLLKKFISERGKIIPKRTSGVCAWHQRRLANAIKRARHMALLPFVILDAKEFFGEEKK
ncbi:MAG TPA: 30S ribosomal protein S18 [Desulfurobacteriaceae bacterium]|nr:30S ribosomal protein S18 [Desulfurobacteriaceae bacterium]